ncbi:MAG: response regulator [Thermoleophilia bacterium]|nr:response regulator [Thermoleophilia bacterium]
MRILIVDDDAGLRALLRATFESFEVEVDEADSVAAAERRIARARPDVVVLDVLMPGESGLELCRRLKAQAKTRGIGVVLLSGGAGEGRAQAREAGADAYLSKPFSPLHLLGVADRLAGGPAGVPLRLAEAADEEGQLLLYARDLRHMLDLERRQRHLLERAYRQTVAALVAALEQKDTGTRYHSERVVAYAVELARGIDARLAVDSSAEYGFLLHDIGKIGIPDRILGKRGSLTRAERKSMEQHTVLGEQMLAEVPLLAGEGLRVVRSHHERWDGQGYPDGQGGAEIPLGARVFAVADTLDAVTSHRPYRRARSWSHARAVILEQAGRQFDPDVVDAFRQREGDLRRIRRELAVA